jgi:LuxR family maltose regulon positive regulatory protein
MPEVVDAQVVALLREGNLSAAAQLAEKYEVPIGLARVRLAQRDPSAALALLAVLRGQMEANRWEDEKLKVMLLESIALEACGNKEKAVRLLSEALALAERGGFLRIFIDEGKPMARLLSATAATGLMPEYINRLLAAFEISPRSIGAESPANASAPAQALVEPLSPRELEVLRLIAEGLSNREISDRLFVALITVKGHNQRIFGKLGVQRRTEAVARARDLGLL